MNRTALLSRIVSPFTVRIRAAGRSVMLRLAPDRQEGGFVVSSLTLGGLHTQGDTLEEALAHGHEAALALLTEPRRRRRA